MLALFGNALLVGFSGALMPGPLLTAVVAQSTQRGLFGGIRTVSGHALLELAVVAVMALGIGQAITNPSSLRIIYALGAVTLGWMGLSTARYGLGLWRKGGGPELAGGDATVRLPLPEVAGALTSGTNPYWLVWWATAGASYLALAMEISRFGPIVFYFGHIAADFLWYLLVSAAVVGGGKFLGPKFYSGLLMVCGVAMVVIATTFATLAVKV